MQGMSRGPVEIGLADIAERNVMRPRRRSRRDGRGGGSEEGELPVRRELVLDVSHTSKTRARAPIPKVGGPQVSVEEGAA